MKKTTAFVTLLIVTIFSVQGQLLWKVTSAADNDCPDSYLLGTYHLIGYDKVDSITGISAVLEMVDGVVGEMDMAMAMGNEGQAVMMKHATAPSGFNLSALLSRSQLDSLQYVLDDYMPGITVEQLDGLLPAFVSVMIETSRAARVSPLPGDAVDAEIQRRALEYGKTVSGLESIEDQCLALFGAPVVEQAQSLVWAVEHDSDLMTLSRKILDAYLAGDLNEILTVIENPRYMSADDADRLIVRRNADWLRVLAGLLPAASLLIVVGAGHLPGKDGLIEGLRSKGYEVTPVITE